MTIANAAAAPRPKGPQTPEAKERVRRNALKHGLRAETLVSDEDKGAIAEKVAAWTIELAPVGDVERTLVQRAAADAVRLDRCRRAEQAAMEESAARSARAWEARARSRVRKLAGRLNEEPAAVVEELESSAFGIDWLLGRWRELRGLLELRQGKDLVYASIRLMSALMRIDARIGHEALAADASAGALWGCGLSALGYHHERYYLYRIYAGTAGLDPSGDPHGQEAFQLLPSRDSARQALRAAIDREVGRLEALRDEVYEAVEAPARAEAIERGLIDTSEEGRRRLRYEQVHERTMHRSLNDLSRRQKERRKSADSAPDRALWARGVVEPAAIEPGPSRPDAPAPNNTATAPDAAPTIDDKPDPTEDLQPEAPPPSEPEAARTDLLAGLSPEERAFAREVMERCRQEWGAPGFGDEGDPGAGLG